MDPSITSLVGSSKRGAFLAVEDREIHLVAGVGDNGVHEDDHKAADPDRVLEKGLTLLLLAV